MRNANTLAFDIVLSLNGMQVSPPIVAAVGASLIAWLEGKTDKQCTAAAGVSAALHFVQKGVEVRQVASKADVASVPY